MFLQGDISGIKMIGKQKMDELYQQLLRTIHKPQKFQIKDFIDIMRQHQRKWKIVKQNIKFFFSSSIDVQNGNFCPSINSIENSIKVPSAIIVYGVDFLEINQIMDMLQNRQVKIFFLDDSSCKIFFKSHQQVQKVFLRAGIKRLELGKSRLGKNKLYEDWFGSYQQLGFQRNLYARYANNIDLERNQGQRIFYSKYCDLRRSFIQSLQTIQQIRIFLGCPIKQMQAQESISSQNNQQNSKSESVQIIEKFIQKSYLKSDSQHQEQASEQKQIISKKSPKKSVKTKAKKQKKIKKIKKE